ncbi:MAG: type VI secretion system ATPase TssH, partial [Pseudomonadota bacterium]
MTTTLKTLISKLNTTTRKAAERAANLCLARGHYEVDLEHLFLALLEEPGSDLETLCRQFDVPVTGLQRDLEQELARLQTGNTRTPVFSPHLPKLLEHAWLIASLDVQTPRIRSAHLLLALLTEPNLSSLALRGSPLFAKFPVDELKHRWGELTATSQEAREGSPVSARPPVGGGGESAVLSGRTPALDLYTTHLTQRAKEGHLDPVIGRDAEIRQVIDILMRRRQNNPILTGEAGVGKTAVVEGLALRIAKGDVPPPLQGVALHVLDMGLLQAGASVKGEFESRLRQVIDEVKKSPHPIILFIDEAHTLIGAGGQAGQNDAANLLKPALARGELRTIAATTWSEYKKYFEKDAALARRFQVVKVEEPSEPVAAAMLRAMVPLMERHFGVRVLDEAITEAVRLSARYISGRQLPDKAVSVLDTACARVALGQQTKPARIEEAEREIERLDVEIRALEREAATGRPHLDRLAELNAARQARRAELEDLRVRFDQERVLVAEVQALRAELEAAGELPVARPSPAARGRKAPAALALTPRQQALKGKLDELAALQRDTPMLPLQVDASAVAQIVSAWTGIPLGKMVKDEIDTVRELKSLLEQRVIGQPHALEAIAQRVRTSRAQLEDPNKPKGVFLFVGPSGVGKTETALALADILYGGERNLITIN